LFSYQRLRVDQFPDVTFPVVTASVPYPGAGPSEMETLVARPLEEELSTISGVKRLTSISQEGVATVVAEFTLETDIKFAEQQIRDRVGAAKRKLPRDILEPVIRRIDPADQPILILALDADLPPAKLYDLADELVKPKIQQVAQVGLVEVLGGRKREIRVELDQTKLKQRELSATQVAMRLGQAGENVPAGKVDVGGKEIVFRTVAEFDSLDDVKNAVVSFVGNDVSVTVGDIGRVVDGLEDQKSLAYINGKKSLFLYVFRQSGSNTIAVVDGVKKALDKINSEISKNEGKPQLTIVRDGSFFIRANVLDVYESIVFGTILAILVVYLFLANIRSTIITGLALPNSLIGAFILMALAGFSINIMSLLALSLAVGLLVDDAIVVRENIFRHIEMGKDPIKASREGTMEVQLAVIATTLVVIAVFGPVGFLKGVVGQFFKQFGLTMCFAMAISLFDALTIAPMLSAYFAGKNHGISVTGIWGGTVGRVLLAFSKFQDWLEGVYERILRFTVRFPAVVLVLGLVIFLGSFGALKYVPKTFLPTQDNGEFSIGLDLPPGTSLEEMKELTLKVDETLRKNPEVEISAATVGSRDAESNVASIYVRLVSSKLRSMNTSQVKEKIREQLKVFSDANPVVKDYDAVGGGMRPFTVNIVGFDQKELERVSTALLAKLKKYPGLKDVDVNFRAGKPEFQFELDPAKADKIGLLPVAVGQELRTLIEGAIPKLVKKYPENSKSEDFKHEE
jgi:HAE1 family hydrophobic/amphiphilic exporter-1